MFGQELMIPRLHDGIRDAVAGQYLHPVAPPEEAADQRDRHELAMAVCLEALYVDYGFGGGLGRDVDEGHILESKRLTEKDSSEQSEPFLNVPACDVAADLWNRPGRHLGKDLQDRANDRAIAFKYIAIFRVAFRLGTILQFPEDASEVIFWIAEATAQESS
jgi:hypothetical protein